ncbi:MAG: DUF5063 domain-containing protein [Bacteroidales bacterium]|jgi:hypothetical protein|nr:DUF5063 domain-containing protein [Bacteroidales bacterium]
MEEGFDSNIVYSKNVTEFVTVASEYCKFVENTPRFSKRDFLNKAHKILPLLYLKSTLLPGFHSIFEDENEKFVSEEEWDFIHQSVKKKLGYHDDYREVFDPLTHEQVEQSTASIADNLADIYQDIKNFISLYHIGTEEIMNDALWECQVNFEEFWGQKLVNALKAVHAVFYSGDNLDDEEPTEDNQPQDELNTDDWIISKRQKDYNNED